MSIKTQLARLPRWVRQRHKGLSRGQELRQPCHRKLSWPPGRGEARGKEPLQAGMCWGGHSRHGVTLGSPCSIPWQAQTASHSSLRNVCLNHGKVIKICEPPIPLWTGSDHPSQLSALFPAHLGCSAGFIPITMAKPANTSLHCCTENYKKTPVYLHTNGRCS